MASKAKTTTTKTNASRKAAGLKAAETRAQTSPMRQKYAGKTKKELVERLRELNEEKAGQEGFVRLVLSGNQPELLRRVVYAELDRPEPKGQVRGRAKKAPAKKPAAKRAASPAKRGRKAATKREEAAPVAGREVAIFPFAREVQALSPRRSRPATKPVKRATGPRGVGAIVIPENSRDIKAAIKASVDAERVNGDDVENMTVDQLRKVIRQYNADNKEDGNHIAMSANGQAFRRDKLIWLILTRIYGENLGSYKSA